MVEEAGEEEEEEEEAEEEKKEALQIRARYLRHRFRSGKGSADCLEQLPFFLATRVLFYYRLQRKKRGEEFCFPKKNLFSPNFSSPPDDLSIS